MTAPTTRSPTSRTSDRRRRSAGTAPNRAVARHARARRVVGMTDLLYLRDAYLREFTATVTKVDGDRVVLDRSAFYPTGGGQPHDTGTLGDAAVTDVRQEGD